MRSETPGARQLAAQGLAEGALGGLGGPVGGGVGEAALAGARGDDHDVAVPRSSRWGRAAVTV